MRKTIDTGNHCCSIFAKAVQNYAQGLNSYFIGCLCNTDSALSSRKRFMACQEAEAIGFFAEQHGCQITVAKANFSLVSYRTGNAECLQADADSFGCISCFFAALFEGNCSTQCIGPNGIFKCDRLNGADDAVYIQAFFYSKSLHLFQRGEAIFCKALFDFRNSSFVTFKLYHDIPP